MSALTDPNSTNQADLLARKILSFYRDSLLVQLRFLDAAIHQLQFQQVEKLDGIATDGQFFYYDSWYVLETYQQQKETIARNYLHCIFHCLFQHLFINNLLDQDCWDLACDIAVENVINDLNITSLQNNRQSQQTEVLDYLKRTLHLLTAEKIYRYYRDQNLSADNIACIRKNFYADDHTLWYSPPERQPSNGGDEANSKTGAKVSKPCPALVDQWKQISERAQVDIETASRKWGNTSGGLYQGLNQLNREKANYAEFLKKFSVMGEDMQVNDEEFDLIFYTYGLKLYEKMPLIEPLEYKEVKRIKEFVIAIDTSGSVIGDTVQAFIQKTYNILLQTENFFTKVNIHIIQCDTEIQEDHKITSVAEFEKYIHTMELRGFGGTDFRPVFTYVDQLIEKREFENLKGLIYFTDGYGTYPSKKPKYDTAFVFLVEDYVDNPYVPPWAIKLVLSTDEVIDNGEWS